MATSGCLLVLIYFKYSTVRVSHCSFTASSGIFLSPGKPFIFTFRAVYVDRAERGVARNFTVTQELRQRRNIGYRLTVALDLKRNSHSTTVVVVGANTFKLKRHPSDLQTPSWDVFHPPWSGNKRWGE